jgi:transposase
VLTDAQWALIAPQLPSSPGRRGRRFTDDRRVVEGIIYPDLAFDLLLG